MELGDHRPAGGLVTQPRVHLDRSRLAAGADPHEDRDQDQQRVAHQPHQPEPDRQRLPDPRRHPRGAHPVHAQRQHRPQHPPAVHRERRQQVEGREQQVGGEQARQDAVARRIDVDRRPRPRADLHHQVRADGGVDVHDDVVAHDLLETFQAGFDAVDTLFDVREDIVAVRVGSGRAADVGACLGDGDGGVYSRRAVCVADRAEQRTFDSLPVTNNSGAQH